MADERLFDLEVISPERVFYKGRVEFVELVTSEGEIGVYKNHIPMTSVLIPGIITIHEEGKVKNAAIHSGFVVILKDKMKVMAEVAEWPDEIDESRANEAKSRAEKRLKEGGPNIDTARAEAALKRSMARLGLKNIK
ncbi:MAG: ATP synthase F1 subunit epsilon [Lachnospiraceae bacterium]|nr:ATP synthase F1 subunit epsilon [Lachnospiraceae bacterium]